MAMEPIFIGREKETQILREALESREAEMIAVLGRRRVGKTSLIKHVYAEHIDFEATGVQDAPFAEQLQNFALRLNDTFHGGASVFKPSNWLEAFYLLGAALDRKKKEGTMVVFLDELPWFDSHKSGFIRGLGYFWNSWAVNKSIIVVICGSAASWMINVLINHTGGLHNRVTNRLKIEPFCLQEVEVFLQKKNCVFERYQTLQLYMALGGIPFYLDAIKPDLSAAQNIQRLFFEKNSFLKNEFFNLYRSLFKKHAIYEQIVEVLSSKPYGLQRNELIKLSSLSSGGTLTKVLADLEESGFITSYAPFDDKNKNTIYRLSDYYTAFYFRFIKDSPYKGKDAWLNLIDNPLYWAWQGFSFEQICIDHIAQVKKGLGIQSVLSKEVTWKGRTETKAAQIDLLIDRRDQVINICECKFSLDTFTIDKAYADKLRQKISVFKDVTRTRKAVFLTMLTTYGVEKNKYANLLVQNEVTMNDLFAIY